MYIELSTTGHNFGGELGLFAAASLLKRSIVVVNNAPASTAHRVIYKYAVFVASLGFAFRRPVPYHLAL